MLKNTITPEGVYNNRRKFLKTAGFVTAGIIGSFAANAEGQYDGSGKLNTNHTNQLTSFEDFTSYNNYYEFGTGKGDPKRYSQNFDTSNWEINVHGHVKNPMKFSMQDLLDFETEEQIHSFRCVEGWSAIVPWNGFKLSKLLDIVKPTAKGKYVRFVSVEDKKQMRGQNRPTIRWPYQEGLRLDEAMQPITMMATGLYGKPLPNQNGAPIRLVVPWKYGFKYPKAIVEIELVEDQPNTSWNDLAPREYGFYSNVNPNISHPRWSQRTERVLGTGLIAERKETMYLNGYEKEVGHLYPGDQREYY